MNLLDPDHVERVRRVFAAANRLHLPIVAHLWTADPRYGREHSEIFLDRLVSAAPGVPIQVAHMGASGPGYHADEAIAVFADAAAAHDPRVRNLWFDVATLAVLDLSDQQVELLTRRIRQIGTGRILFGSDSPGDLSAPPKMAWATFRVVLPLSDREIRDIAGNVPPYMR